MKTWKPMTAGILMIIAGIVEAIFGILGTVIGGAVAGWVSMPGLGGLVGVTAILIVLGIVAIVGGIYSLKRQTWGLALAGAICSLFGPWFILGILAIIFVSMGKSEFSQGGASVS
ncbi:MAG: hypothetical protein J7K94_05745 [Dehalococcoidia bacterium]|nr:hypothetical protein [Dehalococcoidia bacterium]